MGDSCDSSVLLTHYTRIHTIWNMFRYGPAVTFKGKQGKLIVLPFIFISYECRLPFNATSSCWQFLKILGRCHKSDIDLLCCPLKLFCPWTPYVVSVGRLEEREVELKKEYNSLHQRHTEVRKDWGEKKDTFQLHYSATSLVSSTLLLWPLQMIHNYMEHVERIKLQQFNETSETSTIGRVRSVGNKYNLGEFFGIE